MNLYKTICLLLMLLPVYGFSQTSNEETLYVVDSIPIIEEPKEGFGILTENEIDHIVYVKDKELIENSEYNNLDVIVYVFTKAYVQRADSIKIIPTTKRMFKKQGAWYLKNHSVPYSGRFIDYYLTGLKEGEGFFVNGRLNGIRKLYYPNGNLSSEIEYVNGYANGQSRNFYENGVLKQDGVFKNGKEIGIWNVYHSNKELKQKIHFNEFGEIQGDMYSYYSTGELKGVNTYEKGIYKEDKLSDKLFKYYKESQDLFRKSEYKNSIKKINKAIELKPNWAEAYFLRGTVKLEDFQFEKAKEDFEKAITIEPLYMEAYANRAFSILRKYEFKNGQFLTKSRGVLVITSQKNEIPEEDLNKICTDLKKAISLGDTNTMVLEALRTYCSE
ncbi:hypothetical protein [uncultured Dokdonia sp.]|uniref:hypothetical protein n=1 Tax=uncultured Dokdonia sp. TaxID=575653 RepID=UPI0026266DFB|nr:hypothetical protein [uncultured Dokdonia sp.]